jgi:hypothetical protein
MRAAVHLNQRSIDQHLRSGSRRLSLTCCTSGLPPPGKSPVDALLSNDEHLDSHSTPSCLRYLLIKTLSLSYRPLLQHLLLQRHPSRCRPRRHQSERDHQESWHSPTHLIITLMPHLNFHLFLLARNYRLGDTSRSRPLQVRVHPLQDMAMTMGS